VRLGGALRQLREEKGLKQIEVASGASVTESQVSELERGRNDARWTTVARIVEDGLGASFEDLARLFAEA
jgi:transcriptional regulator with XRE-family HTH domain